MGFPPMNDAPALMPKWKWDWASLPGSQGHGSFHLDEDYCVRADTSIGGNPCECGKFRMAIAPSTGLIRHCEVCPGDPDQCMDPTNDGDQVNPYYHRWNVKIDKAEVNWKEPMHENHLYPDVSCPGWRDRYGQPGQKHDSDGRVVSILPSDTSTSSDSPALSIEALAGITVPNDSSADPVVLPAPVLVSSTLNNNNGDITDPYDVSGNFPGSNIFGITPLDLTPPAAQPQLQSTPIQSPFWTFGKRTRKLKRQSPRDFR